MCETGGNTGRRWGEPGGELAALAGAERVIAEWARWERMCIEGMGGTSHRARMDRSMGDGKCEELGGP